VQHFSNFSRLAPVVKELSLGRQYPNKDKDLIGTLDSASTLRQLAECRLLKPLAPRGFRRIFTGNGALQEIASQPPISTASRKIADWAFLC
jgi:hypothetical protein